MSKKQKKIIGPAEKDDLVNLTNAATVMECTGLMQRIPDNEDKKENYNEVYSYTKKD